MQDQVPPFSSKTAVSPEDRHKRILSTRILILLKKEVGIALIFLPPQVIAEYLQKIDTKSDGAKRDWVAIYDECASVLYQKFDQRERLITGTALSRWFSAI
ncbi:UbiB domain [Salvia divinorum]|uniref:UbiB domain n=1 Tax=Salvia divinorum TaxID=28513 RepID=A0ABD1IJH1_SALDI